MSAQAESDGELGPRIYRRGPDVAYVDSEGRSALLDLRHLADPPLVLQGSAAEIWQSIDGNASEADIIDVLVELYDEHESLIAPAVRTFIADLLQRGLIEEVANE